MPADPIPAPLTRVRGLDGLRGLAVAAVVAFHLDHYPGGWLGVDAFFTLSGFLITSLLLAEIDREQRLDLRRFWRRRIRRLQPAALVCIAVVVGSAGWWANDGTGRVVRGDALAAIFNVANWHLLWSHQSYAAVGNPSPLEHFWSLAIEEQFYILWPLALMAVVVLARGRVRTSMIGLAAAGFVVSLTVLAVATLQRGYLGTDARMGSILLGALLACVLPLGGEPIRHARAIGIAGIIGMVALWTVAGWPPHVSLAITLPANAICVSAAIIGATRGTGALMSWRPIVALGVVSFGVYLWHWPVIVILTPERLHQNELVTDIIRLAIIAVLTIVSWRLIEKPVRTEHLWRATRYVFPIGLAVAVFVSFAGAARTGPLPVFASAKGQITRTQNPVANVTRAAGSPQRVLVVGDSIPTSLLSSADASGGLSLQVGEGRLLEDLAAAGISAASATLTGCPVVDEAIVADRDVRAYCIDELHHLLPAAMEQFHPDLVVWYSSAESYPYRGADGKTHDPLASPDEAAALRARIAHQVDWFGAHGAKVVFVSPGPSGQGKNTLDLRHDSRKSMTFLDDTLREVAASNPNVAGVIAMSDLTCPGWQTSGSCPDRMPNGTHYRASDGEHYEGAGAVAAGQWLVDRVAAVKLGR